VLKSLQKNSQTPGENGKFGVLEELHAIFIQTVAHELRTPLSIILVYAELLRSEDLGTLSSLQKNATDTIVSRAKALRTIVERVDVMLAARAGSKVLIPTTIPEILKELIESKRAEARSRGLSLDLFIDQEFPLVACDPYQLRLAIDCLLDNAFKFTPQGGLVALHAYTEPGWICLEVSDTGIGIPDEELERVFAPFYQVDGSSTRRYPGVGLGLGVVKAVVAGHDGRVEASSQRGRGSRFTIKLPETLIVGQTEGHAAGDADVQRILIVDDEANVALTMQASLEKLPGCKAVAATSGEEALRLFEQTPFDLLITDYKMPGTDGMTLAAHVQRLYPQTSIVMVTAFGSETLREQARKLSIECVLDKPVQLDDIRNVALEALGRNGNPTMG
jgi:CheY-like chemotaxis protein